MSAAAIGSATEGAFAPPLSNTLGAEPGMAAGACAWPFCGWWEPRLTLGASVTHAPLSPSTPAHALLVSFQVPFKVV